MRPGTDFGGIALLWSAYNDVKKMRLIAQLKKARIEGSANSFRQVGAWGWPRPDLTPPMVTLGPLQKTAMEASPDHVASLFSKTFRASKLYLPILMSSLILRYSSLLISP